MKNNPPQSGKLDRVQRITQGELDSKPSVNTEWRERFDEKFTARIGVHDTGEVFTCWNGNTSTPETVKSFISQVEKEAKEEGRRERDGDVKKAYDIGFESGVAFATPHMITMDMAEQQARETDLKSLLQKEEE